jgi:hypothetical protein
VVIVTANVWTVGFVPQVLPADTVTFPLTAEPEVETVMDVPVLVVMLQPDGTVQLYTVAFATAVMLNVAELLIHNCAPPVIATGAAGVPAPTVTARVAAELVPQLFVAVTVTFPFCPAAPEVAVIDSPLLLPWIDQPFGTVHVYEAAFVTALIE